MYLENCFKKQTKRNGGTKHAFGAEYVFDPRWTIQTNGRIDLLADEDSALSYFAGLTVSQTVSSVTLLDMCSIPKLKEKKKRL